MQKIRVSLFWINNNLQLLFCTHRNGNQSRVFSWSLTLYVIYFHLVVSTNRIEGAKICSSEEVGIALKYCIANRFSQQEMVLAFQMFQRGLCNCLTHSINQKIIIIRLLVFVDFPLTVLVKRLLLYAHGTLCCNEDPA